jgi:hypothetical protein
MAIDPIITLSEYKSLMGVQSGDTRDDPQITALLSPVSRAVRAYAGRSFVLADPTPSVRTFLYDGSGFLDLDDCSSVTLVTTDAGVAGQTFSLDTTQYTVMPQDDSEVFYYLVVNGGPFGISPEMGFRYNLDTIGLKPKDPMISVTATWGWPEIPDDVKLATAMTINEFMGSEAGNSEGLSSEAIAGWSRSWGGRSSGYMALAIPNRARDLLSNYQRMFV